METNIHVSRRKVDEKSVKKLRQQYCPESGHKKAKLGLAVIRKLIERNNKLKRFILFNRKREGVERSRVTKRSSWREKRKVWRAGASYRSTGARSSIGGSLRFLMLSGLFSKFLIKNNDSFFFMSKNADTK